MIIERVSNELIAYGIQRNHNLNKFKYRTGRLASMSRSPCSFQRVRKLLYYHICFSSTNVINLSNLLSCALDCFQFNAYFTN